MRREKGAIMNKDTKKNIELLISYLLYQEDVSFAFLFGSRLEKARSGSDWDIGIYITPLDSNILEWENPRIWAKENKVFSDLTKILKTDNIDLIILNRIPAHLADVIVREGLELVVKDRVLFLDFLLTVSREAEDYRSLVEDYYEIYQRSSSLSKEDRVSLEKRIVFLENELKDFSYYKEFKFSDYQTDFHKKRELERWIENIINAIIDISKVILSSHKSEIPETYREIVEKMSRFKLPDETVELLAGWTRLRNILAHEYLDMRWHRIRDFLDRGEDICLDFLTSIKRML